MGLVLITLAFIYKLTPESLQEILMRTMVLLENLYALGWVFLIFVLILWRFTRKLKHEEHLRELGRIGLEKSELQERLIGRTLVSSDEIRRELNNE